MMNTRNTFALSMIGLLMAVITASCEKVASGLSDEEIAILDFVEERNITVEPTASGLYYIELEAGVGDFPLLSDTVEVYYKGMFLDGRVFEARLSGEPFAFAAYELNVIRGWEEGISYMKPGGKAMLIIPSYLGYGARGSGSIPGSTPLLFEIEILNIRPGPNHVAPVK